MRMIFLLIIFLIVSCGKKKKRFNENYAKLESIYVDFFCNTWQDYPYVSFIISFDYQSRLNQLIYVRPIIEYSKEKVYSRMYCYFDEDSMLLTRPNLAHMRPYQRDFNQWDFYLPLRGLANDLETRTNCIPSDFNILYAKRYKKICSTELDFMLYIARNTHKVRYYPDPLDSLKSVYTMLLDTLEIRRSKDFYISFCSGDTSFIEKF